MKKKLVAGAIGALMASGTVYASVPSADAPTGFNMNGLQGDLLFAPAVMVTGDWNSELTVVNNDAVNAIVARVSVQQKTDSGDLLDFLIYLSPNDVWKGTLSCGDAACSTMVLTSADDSIPAKAVTANTSVNLDICPVVPAGFASAANPTSYSLSAPLVAGMGYVKVVGAWASDMGDPTAKTAPISKDAIAARYLAAAKTPDATCLNSTVPAANDAPNKLSATVRLVNTTGANELAIPMAAITNYDNQAYLSIGTPAGLSPVGPVAVSKIGDVEDAIWNTNNVVPYVNGGNRSTYAIATFPTWHRWSNRYQGMYANGFANGISFRCDVFDMSEATPSTGSSSTTSGQNCKVVGWTNQSPPSPIYSCTPGPTITTSGRTPVVNTGTWVDEVNMISFDPLTTNGNSGSCHTGDYNEGMARLVIEQVNSTTNSRTPTSNTYPAVTSSNLWGAPALVSYIRWITQADGVIQGTWTYTAADNGWDMSRDVTINYTNPNLGTWTY